MAWLVVVAVCLALSGCVDAFDPQIKATVDVLVVDGMITNLPEPQIIRINRSRADPITGRFGTSPVTDATVEVIVDSSQVVPAHETVDGSYQLPSDFRGQTGRTYQLRITLKDGTTYLSNQQLMPPVSPIERVQAEFNPRVPRPNHIIPTMGAHEFYLDTQDPESQHNYYKWDWTLYERKEWCKSCSNGIYAVYNILPNQYFHRMFVSGDELFEDCFYPPTTPAVNGNEPIVPSWYWVYDYRCRTRCWEIIHNNNLNLFNDALSNGGPIKRRKVGVVPYNQRSPALVVIRQSGITPEAHSFFTLVETQTQNSGGLADTPPTAPIGNIRNAANPQEIVVGFFSASSVTELRYWLDRRDATGLPIGAYDDNGVILNWEEELFYALTGRRPSPEPLPPFSPLISIYGGPPRVPTAICENNNTSTPFKPEGWRDE
ncbi:DUF4249 domain-containing protein [Telluribacter sp. SYSU D00476]|uniref:DUF4249 domain-containing protein n=1 Tax=Telluribacter sp. SYSU D00476 TaxID=2811430 RepID=UPI001FF3F158|nr:DUF4249 domain-containing protein [Telluribacter sp. SYSU D00476]